MCECERQTSGKTDACVTRSNTSSRYAQSSEKPRCLASAFQGLRVQPRSSHRHAGRAHRPFRRTHGSVDRGTAPRLDPSTRRRSAESAPARSAADHDRRQRLIGVQAPEDTLLFELLVSPAADGQSLGEVAPVIWRRDHNRGLAKVEACRQVRPTDWASSLTSLYTQAPCSAGSEACRNWFQAEFMTSLTVDFFDQVSSRSSPGCRAAEALRAW